MENIVTIGTTLMANTSDSYASFAVLMYQAFGRKVQAQFLYCRTLSWCRCHVASDSLHGIAHRLLCHSFSQPLLYSTPWIHLMSVFSWPMTVVLAGTQCFQHHLECTPPERH